MLSIDPYWSFRSPYSYLVLPRILALTQEFRVVVRLRIVHPAAVRNPAYFKAMNPLARPYFFKDSARMAQYLGMPFRCPVPDPIVQDPVTLVIATEQPYVHRLGRLGIAAVRRGRGLAYCDQVSRILWDGTVDGWHTDDHLVGAARRADSLQRTWRGTSPWIQHPWTPNSRRMTQPCVPPAIGGCRPWCSMESPSRRADVAAAAKRAHRASFEDLCRRIISMTGGLHRDSWKRDKNGRESRQ